MDSAAPFSSFLVSFMMVERNVTVSNDTIVLPLYSTVTLERGYVIVGRDVKPVFLIKISTSSAVAMVLLSGGLL